MRTTISLADNLFEEVERLVQRSGRRRSDVYAEALREYVARHALDDVTASLDRVIEQLAEPPVSPDFVTIAAQRILRATEW